MKSIFTRPVFINPQAYLVIPELALIHRSTPYDFSSNQYVFQVITTGQIEGKLLQAGNEYILHLDLYSKDGNVVLGEFYLDGSSIGNVDDFILEQSNGFVTITFRRGSISYPGLIAAWSAKGKSNDDEDRAILKDLTGNGHDISLKGFAFKEMSGYGGYPINFTKVFNYGNGNKTAIIMHKIGKVDANFGIFWGTISQEIPSIKIKVTGISNTNANLRYKYVENKTDIKASYYDMNKDGVYTLPKSVISPNIKNDDWKGFTISKTVENIDLTIELLPEYPDALVFDGVDDYGINEDMPILTDYTLIINRKYINTNKSTCLISKSAVIGQGAFIMEMMDIGNNTIYSFGQLNFLPLYNDNISYLTSNKYNSIDINKGTVNDTSAIALGTIRPNDNMRRFFNGAFYSAYLFNRSLTEQEIKSFIRKHIDPEYLLPSEIPTPDCYYDFSKGSNDDADRNTIKDLSGNGNNAVAHNFAWNNDSGYKDGALYFDGVDDYVDIGISQYKTIFMLMIVPINENVIYCSKYIAPISFYYGKYHIAGGGNNSQNGNYYLNGIRNTTILGNTLYNKKHLLTVSNEDAINGNYYIGANKAENKWFTNIRLYKFLGFKEALTEEQIKAIIKKYNLLDGVDDIEVS